MRHVTIVNVVESRSLDFLGFAAKSEYEMSQVDIRRTNAQLKLFYYRAEKHELAKGRASRCEQRHLGTRLYPPEYTVCPQFDLAFTFAAVSSHA
jgi:hypothetical protein